MSLTQFAAIVLIPVVTGPDHCGFTVVSLGFYLRFPLPLKKTKNTKTTTIKQTLIPSPPTPKKQRQKQQPKNPHKQNNNKQTSKLFFL